jgi:hypothetical protein
LSQCARQLHTATVYDGYLISVCDEIGNCLAACMKQLFVLKGCTA